MHRPLMLVALTWAIAMIPGMAHARGGYGGKGGTVMTPFGPAYNTGSPEWKQSGGNIFRYQQLVEQKMFMQQQQLMLKQQQQMLKAKQQQKGKTPAPSTLTGPVTTLPRKKKKRRTYDPTHPVTSQAIKADAAKPDGKKAVTAEKAEVAKPKAAEKR